jgi:DNA-binding CsgD family transcriptional regulator
MDVELVGRDGELAAIQAFLDGAAPAMVLLEGEAGIGKTSLWRAVIATRADDSVLVARPTYAEAELSFAALSDLLGDVVVEALPALPEPQRRSLEAALLLAATQGPPPDQRTIGTALLNVVRELASRRPLLLAIDDVQWLDSASLAALTFCVRRLRDEPVRVLLTARTSEDAQPPGLALAIGEDRLERRAVGPLSVGAIRKVLKTRLKTSFQRSVLGRLHETAGGNPFLALEIGRELAHRRARIGPGEPLPVPSSLRQLLEGRLSRLSAPARQVLVAVAAAGKPKASTLARILGGDGVKGVEEAVRADVLVREGEELRFSHPLLRLTAYELAPAPERRLVHRLLAESAVDIEEHAHHLALSTTGPDPQVAAKIDVAAARARARGSMEAAVGLAVRAVELTPANDTESLRRRRLAEADACLGVGRVEQARTALTAALVEARGRDRAEVLCRQAFVAANLEAAQERTIELAGAGLAELGDSDDDLRATFELTRCLAYAELGHPAEAARGAQAAVAAAEAAGDDGLLGRALGARFELGVELGDGEDIPLILRALELSDRRPYSGAPSPHETYARYLSMTYQVDAAREVLLRLLRLDRELGAVPAEAYHLYLMARNEIHACRWRDAAQYASESAQLGREEGLPKVSTGALYPLAQARMLLGELEQAGETVKEIGLCEEQLGVSRSGRSTLLALAAFSCGDHAQAVEHFAVSLAARPAADPAWSPDVPTYGEALVAVGRLDEAKALLDRYEQRARLRDRPVHLAATLRSRGLLRAAEGDMAGAGEAFDEALVQHRRLENPFERGRTLLALGAFQRRARQRRLARDTLQEAQRVFDDLGAKLWAEQALAELRRVGGRAGSPTELTPSEHRIADLVAEGKTNKEVAAILVVADRTVESALTQIYRKLDVRSRTELTRKLTASA